MKALIKAGAAILWGVGVLTPAPSFADDGAQAIDGRWDAKLIQSDVTIPFRLDIAGSGPSLKGTFYNGFDPYDGTTGSFLRARTADAPGGALSNHHQSDPAGGPLSRDG